MVEVPLSFWCLLFYREVVLTNTADGAYPILGDVFKRCSGSDTAIGIAYFWIINITTCVANVLFHNLKHFLVSNGKYVFYFFYDSLWCNIVHTGIVASTTRLLSVDATRTALQVCLDDVGLRLSPS